MSSSSITTAASTTTTTSLSLDHFPPSEQLCYLQCSRCETVLAVSVPSSSLYKTVTVRCGHCTHLLPVNTRSLLQPPPPPTTQFHNYYSPTSHYRLGEMANQGPNFTLTQPSGASSYMNPSSSRSGSNDLPRAPTTNRPPEKGRGSLQLTTASLSKEEIQRIKAENPDISHREAFSAAAKNWAHFPHIHFGLMPDQTAKRTSNMRPHHPQETGEDIRLRSGFFGGQANVGVSPY